MDNPAHPHAFIFVGGSLWLDFVNTRYAARRGPVELLPDFAALSRWCLESGAFERAALSHALKQMAPITESERIVAHAHEFRAALHEIAARLAAGKPATAAALEALNRELLHRTGYHEVVREGRGYRKQLLMRIDSPAALLVPVAVSAADMLTSGEPSLVRKCANPGCVLFFHDTSRNHRRRWCSMRLCGNRTKAAAHYARTQDA